jgi:hypothetical protein
MAVLDSATHAVRLADVCNDALAGQSPGSAADIFVRRTVFVHAISREGLEPGRVFAEGRICHRVRPGVVHCRDLLIRVGEVATMSMTRGSILVAMGVSVTCCAFTGGSYAASTAAMTKVACPAVTASSRVTMLDVARAAPTVLGRAYAKDVDISSKFTHVVVVAIASLGPTGVRGVSGFRTTAIRNCGVHVANPSWVVEFELPESKIPLTRPRIAFLIRSGSRWLVWLRTLGG